MHSSFRYTPSLVNTFSDLGGASKTSLIACKIWSLIWLVSFSSGASLYKPNFMTRCCIFPLSSTKPTMMQRQTLLIVVSSKNILRGLPAVSSLISLSSSAYITEVKLNVVKVYSSDQALDLVP